MARFSCGADGVCAHVAYADWNLEQTSRRPNMEQRTRRLDGWMGRAAWHKLRDTGSEKAMKDTGRTGCDGHLLARACIGRALTLFRQACALGTVVAAVSCSGPESGDGDHGQLIEQIVPILDRVSSMLITALFFTLLIIWTKWSRALADKKTSGADFVMLFGVLITGIFIFMTFRIDRGSQNESRRVADTVADSVASDVADSVARDVADSVARDVADSVARDVADSVANAVATDVARRGVEVAVAKPDPDAVVDGTAASRIRREIESGADRFADRLGIGMRLTLGIADPENARDLQIGVEQRVEVESDGSPQWFILRVSDGMRGVYQVNVRGLDGGGFFGFDPMTYLYSFQNN